MSKKSGIFLSVKEENPDISDEQVTKSINSVFDTIFDALENENKAEIRGFCSFLVKERPARTARNPRTGESVDVPAKNVISFKVGKELKSAVNDAA